MVLNIAEHEGALVETAQVINHPQPAVSVVAFVACTLAAATTAPSAEKVTQSMLRRCMSASLQNTNAVTCHEMTWYHLCLMAPERLAIEKVRGPNLNGGAAEQERTVRCRLVALHLTILNFAVVNLAVMNGRIAEIFCFDGCAT